MIPTAGERDIHFEPARLVARATLVLRDNDTGALVTAAPKLYPHMWSWDAAFISIGLAYLDVNRAVTELGTLLAAQWSDGMIPHIVFTEDSDYFPGPDRWGTDSAPQAPAGVRTSGICQPPVHAIALRRIVEIAHKTSRSDTEIAEQFARRAWPTLYRWHRWIVRHRMPDTSGLVSIVHGWESGMDNSPRWDEPYAAVVPGPDLPPYTRLDLLQVNDASERPSAEEYDRYLWLIEQMKRVNYHPDEVVRTSSFLVGDVFTTAVFAVACDSLARLGEDLGADLAHIGELCAWAEQARQSVVGSVHPQTGMARDRDIRHDRWLTTVSIAGFAPLLCGGLPVDLENRLISTLDSSDWSGNSHLLAAVPPSVSPSSPQFDSRCYWRGPQWPVIMWLFGWAFEQRDRPRHASEFRAQGVHLVSDGSFGEYYEPFTGEPLGSMNQSWTAAVVLDWLCGVW
ncbi:glucosylglycerate hydrolase [Nocardia gipuzkoensis]